MGSWQERFQKTGPGFLIGSWRVQGSEWVSKRFRVHNRFLKGSGSKWVPKWSGVPMGSWMIRSSNGFPNDPESNGFLHDPECQWVPEWSGVKTDSWMIRSSNGFLNDPEFQWVPEWSGVPMGSWMIRSSNGFGFLRERFRVQGDIPLKNGFIWRWGWHGFV